MELFFSFFYCCFLVDGFWYLLKMLLFGRILAFPRCGSHPRQTLAGSSEIALGRAGGDLGPTWGHLGAKLNLLGPKVMDFGSKFLDLASKCVDFGSKCVDFGRNVSILG